MEKSEEKYIRKIIKEQMENIDYNTKIDELYDLFRGLEIMYNNFSLDELKRDYKLNAIIEKAKEFESSFITLNKAFNDDDSVGEQEFLDIDNKIMDLASLIDGFIGDLEKMQKIFIAMGDLDKGTSYFKRFSL